MGDAVNVRNIDLEGLRQRLATQASGDLYRAIEDMINTEELAPGSRLPTIRVLADGLGVSVRSVFSVWQRLAAAGLIETRRRGGTVVVGATDRADSLPAPAWRGVDLVSGSADRRLQPNLLRAFTAALQDAERDSPDRAWITDDLRDAVAPKWPFQPEAWVTVGGVGEGLLLAMEAAAVPGSPVVVDEPLSPGLGDALRELDLHPIAVPMDDEGPTAEGLRRVLADRPTAFIYQPGAPFSVRERLKPERIAQLADVLRAHPETISIVENEPLGPLLEHEPPTLGAIFPDRTLRVQAYCRALGVDLKTAVIAGSKNLVKSVIRHRVHGLGSNSKILQNALAFLLQDDETSEVVLTARRIYHQRKERLLRALAQRELTARSGRESIAVWVEVVNEMDAVAFLALRGIAVAPGSKAIVSTVTTQWIQLTTLQLPDSERTLNELADLIARAAQHRHLDALD